MTPYLESQEASLHSEVGADVFVYCPCKFIVQFPGDETHDNREEGNDNGYRQQEWPNVFPDIIIRQNITFALESFDRPVDLIELDGRIN